MEEKTQLFHGPIDDSLPVEKIELSEYEFQRDTIQFIMNILNTFPHVYTAPERVKAMENC